MSKRMYHISQIDLGDSVVLKAKVPSSISRDECRSTLRVCFAPTLRDCVYAQVGCRSRSIEYPIYHYVRMKQRDIIHTNPSIYATYRKLHKPPNVSDFSITGEMWSLEDIHVKRVGYLDLEYMLLHGKIRCTKNSTSNISSRDKKIFKTFITEDDYI